MRCVVCMSRLVPANKVEAIRALGAEVRIVGRSQDDAQAEVDRLVAEEGLVTLPPFDHPDVIAGQGTLGLEIVEDLPERRNGAGPPLRRRPDLGRGRSRSRTAGPQARVIGV